MKKRSLILTCIFLGVTGLNRAQASDLRVLGACGIHEKWNFSSEIPANYRQDYLKFLDGDFSPARSYEEATELLESNSSSGGLKQFGSFWQARALFKAELLELSAEGFKKIAQSATLQATLPLQIAALECLNQIHSAHPAIAFPAQLESSLPTFYGFAFSYSDQATLWEASLNTIAAQVSDSQVEAHHKLSNLMSGSGAYQAFAQALLSSRGGNFSQTVAWLEPYWGKSARPNSLPLSLRKHTDEARMLLARAYYALKQYNLASAQYDRLDRKSNDVIEMLSEMAWSHLQAERYGAAVGAATHLQLGAYRHAFAPEGELIVAMAMNELCQYQDALTAVKLLDEAYRPSYAWLKNWNQHPEPLYHFAIEYLTKKSDPALAPDPIASEWIRSQVFLANQEEIRRLLHQEKDITSQLGDSNSPLWKILLSQALEDSKATRARLVQDINVDLAARNKRLLSQLEWVAQNRKLVEIEIYNGASHDMIWLNAHPKYSEHSKELLAEVRNPEQKHVWDWGKIRPANGGQVEIWEDELGSLRAHLTDNCSNKQKYLALSKSH